MVVVQKMTESGNAFVKKACKEHSAVPFLGKPGRQIEQSKFSEGVRGAHWEELTPIASPILVLPTNADTNGIEDAANWDIKDDCVEAFASKFLIFQIDKNGEGADQNGKNPKDTPNVINS